MMVLRVMMDNGAVAWERFGSPALQTATILEAMVLPPPTRLVGDSHALRTYVFGTMRAARLLRAWRQGQITDGEVRDVLRLEGFVPIVRVAS